MWASIFGLLGAISRTTCALQQRNTCNQMHHVVMMTYSGAIGNVRKVERFFFPKVSVSYSHSIVIDDVYMYIYILK